MNPPNSLDSTTDAAEPTTVAGGEADSLVPNLSKDPGDFVEEPTVIAGEENAPAALPPMTMDAGHIDGTIEEDVEEPTTIVEVEQQGVGPHLPPLPQQAAQENESSPKRKFSNEVHL